MDVRIERRVAVTGFAVAEQPCLFVDPIDALSYE
jgi:hypothetical protein